MKSNYIIAFLSVIIYGIAGSSIAQTITTGAVPSSLCPGDTVYVPFTATGTFQPKNAFTAQLSDVTGSFATSYTTLGTTLDSTATSITGVVPNDVKTGLHYRIRVVSGRPYITGSDNGSDISMGKFIYPAFNIIVGTDIYNHNSALLGEPVTFQNASGGDHGTYVWDFGDGASPQTSTDSAPGPVTYSTTGPKTIKITATSSGGCVSNYVASADYFSVFNCTPGIPSTADIDSTSTQSFNKLNDTIWVVPGGSLTVTRQQQVILAEPGSNINLIGENEIVYLKAGATCNVPQVSSSTIIYADGAGIQLGGNASTHFTLLLKCSSLDFDYTNAPPYHFPTLGVNEKSMSPLTLSLYPNPANDILHVFTGAAMPSSVKLFNTLGETVWSAAGHLSNSVQVPIDNLQNGVYYLQVTAQGKMSTEKVTVIH